MKNIIRIVLFLIVFTFAYIFLSYLKKPNSVDLSNIVGFYGEEKNSLDMVYIGGSASFVYWEPLTAYENYNILSYDFGANTIQAELYEYMVKEALKHQDPELIVIDARAFQYRDVDQPPTEVAYRNVLTGMPYNFNKFNFIEKNVKENLEQDTISYHSDLIKYHDTKNGNNFRTSFKMMTHAYQNELKGFYFVPKVVRMQLAYKYNEDIISISDETTNILKELLEYLKTTKKEVLFVVSPYIENEKEKSQFNYIEKIIEEKGFKFLDANDHYKDMNINFDTDFYNDMHVNILGANKYTNFLANYMLENYEFDLNHSKELTDYWDSLLDNWHEEYDSNKAIINEVIERDGYYDSKNIYIRK